MNEEQTLTRPRSISAEAIIGFGITLGAIGILFLLLGCAQYMREVRSAAFVLLPVGAVLLIVGGTATFVGQSRKPR